MAFPRANKRKPEPKVTVNVRCRGCNAPAPDSVIARLLQSFVYRCVACDSRRTSDVPPPRQASPPPPVRKVPEARPEAVGTPDEARALERAVRAIALAGASNENEARAAAMLACKVIRESGLSLMTPSTVARLKNMLEREG